jgi:3-phosphoshikimate 1-carboxyvinyltransferase
MTVCITAPSSKSLSHRALICAALARGESFLQGVLDSEDLSRTRECLQNLGAVIKPHGDGLLVQGILPRRTSDTVSLNVGESGTTCRLLTAVAAAFPGSWRIHGTGRMHGRPIAHLTEALTRQGVRISFEEKPGYPPLVITGSGLSGGETAVNLEQSSQYLSGLLLAAPLAETRTIIHLLGRSVASWPYVTLTLEMMTAFGAPVMPECRSDNEWQPCTVSEAVTAAPADIRFLVEPGTYQPRSMRVEGDWSNASYFLAAGAVGKVPVTVTGLNRDSAQGDRAMAGILERMGARVVWNGADVTVLPSALRGATLDMKDCPDIVPTVAAVAAFASGQTVMSGAAHLAIKESDRIQAPVTELSKAGVHIEARPDGMIVHGGLPRTKVELSANNDHRMAMSLSLLELGGVELVLDNPACVAKSFPDFWTSWNLIRRANGVSHAF